MRRGLRLLLLAAIALGATSRWIDAQEPAFRLHVAPAVSELRGDGDATTMVTVTARDEQGRLVDRSGRVTLRVNAGRLSAAEVEMRHGVAEVQLSAPILDNEAKALQRSIEVTMLVMQSISSMRPEEVVGEDGRSKVLGKALQAARSGPNASTMTSLRGTDPTVRIIAEMDGVRGKGELRITKVEGEVAQSMRPGLWEGTDITGSSRCYLELERSADGLGGILYMGDRDLSRASRRNGDPLSFHTRGEVEYGFLVVYLFDPEELAMFREQGADFLGIPTGAKTLPGDMVYVVAPPLYLRWVGELTSAQDDGRETEDMAKGPRVSLVAERNLLPGDGTSTTELVLSYRNEKGRPVSGVALEASMMRGGLGGELVAAPSRTNANGQAVFRYRAPEYLTDSLQELGTCKRDTVYVSYRQSENEQGRVQADIGILRSTWAELEVEKLGFDPEYRHEILVSSPRGTVRGRVGVEVGQRDWMGVEKLPLVDAEVTLSGGALGDERDTMTAFTDGEGRFEIDLHYLNWPYEWHHDLGELPDQRFLANHGEQREQMVEKLSRFKDSEFSARVRQSVHGMERGLCLEDDEVAEAIFKQWRMSAHLMATLWMTDKLVEDTGGELVGHCWALLSSMWQIANERFKFTEKIDSWIQEKHFNANRQLETWLKLRDAKGRGGGLKLMIYRALEPVFGHSGMKGKETNPTRLIMNETRSRVLGDLWKRLSDELAKMQLVPQNPLPKAIVGIFQDSLLALSKPRIDRLLAADPEELTVDYDWREARIVARAGQLRADYISIAEWRLAAEEGKAYIELAKDVTLMVGVAVAGLTGGVAVLELWQKINSQSAKIDAAWAATGATLEYRNICNLESECLSMFDHALEPVSGAAVQTASLWLPPAVAWAEPGPAEPAPPGFSGIELEAVDGELPWEALGRALLQELERDLWETEQGYVLLLGAEAETRHGTELVDARRELNESLITLQILAAGSADDRLAGDELERWNGAAARAREAMATVDAATPRLIAAAGRIREQDANTAAGSGATVLVYLVAAVGGCSVLVFLGVVLLRRVRRPRQAAAAAVSPTATDPPLLHLPGGAVHSMQGASLTLGAARECDVVLPWAGVAPLHARLHRAEDGRWWIEQAIAGIEIEVNGATGPSFWLLPGARIRLGSAELLFQSA